MIRSGFLDDERREKLIALARDGSTISRVTRRANAIVLLAANAKLPAREYWNEMWVQTLIHPLAVAGVEPYAANLKAGPDEMLQLYQPHEINIVVTGGETQGTWRIFEGTRMKNATVSVDAWR